MYKDLHLNRDLIESCIELYLEENYENYTIKKQENVDSIRFDILFDNKKMFLDLNFNDKGGTTIQVNNGNEQLEKSKIADYIVNHKLCKINCSDEKNTSVIYKNITQGQYDIIIKQIVSDKNICSKIMEQTEDDNRKFTKLDGRWSDKITLMYLKNTKTLQVQGRALLLFNTVNMYLKNIFVEDINNESIVSEDRQDEQPNLEVLDASEKAEANIETIETVETVSDDAYIFELTDDDINTALDIGEDSEYLAKIEKFSYKITTKVGNSFKEYSFLKVVTPYLFIARKKSISNRENSMFDFGNAKMYYNAIKQLKILHLEVEIPEISNEQNSIVRIYLYQNGKPLDNKYIKKEGLNGYFPKRSERFPNTPAYTRLVTMSVPTILSDNTVFVDTKKPLEVVIDYLVGDEIVYEVDLSKYK